MQRYKIMFNIQVRAAQAFILRHILGCASSVRAAQAFILRSSFAHPSLILRHILGCASSPTFLRSTFAQPSLRVYKKINA